MDNYQKVEFGDWVLSLNGDSGSLWVAVTHRAGLAVPAVQEFKLESNATNQNTKSTSDSESDEENMKNSSNIDKPVLFSFQEVEDRLQQIKKSTDEETEEWKKKISSDNYKLIETLSNILESPDTLAKHRLVCMQLLLHLGALDPVVFSILTEVNALTNWIYQDMQDDDDEIVLLALTFLRLLCQQPGGLSPQAKSKLGFNLVEYLIRLSLEDYDEDNSSLHDAALRALLWVGMQWPSHDVSENRVLNKLIYMKEARELGQQFIITLNRGVDKVSIAALVPLLKKIFANEIACTLFFYTNDLKVLVEVVMREVQSQREEKMRILYMEVFEQILLHSNYKDIRHRQKDVVKLLRKLGRLGRKHPEDAAPVQLTIAQTAKNLLKQCPYLKEPLKLDQ